MPREKKIPKYSVPPVGDPGRPDAVRGLIKQIVGEVQELYWHLGGFLLEVRDSKWFEVWGYESFNDYVTEELDVAERRIRYWIATRREFEKMGVTGDDLKGVGWCKAKEITRIANKRNVKQWIERSKEISHRDLQAEIDASLGVGVEEVEETKFMNFALFPDQWANVQRALERASQVSGSEKMGHNLDLICMHYNFNEQGGVTEEAMLERDIRLLERRHAVQMIALRGEKVAYGKRLVRKIMD